MISHARTFHQSQSKLRRGIVLVLLALGSSYIAEAATIPFTFAVTYEAFVDGVPGPTNLTFPASNSGTGDFAPFGSAIWSETGTATFGGLPLNAGFAVSSLSLVFTVSFNGGADTLTGTDLKMAPINRVLCCRFTSETMTILGGTGIFSQATGFAIPTTTDLPSGNYIGTFATSGSGQITAPGLNAVPEPSTIALLGGAMAALVMVIRRSGGKADP